MRSGEGAEWISLGLWFAGSFCDVGFDLGEYLLQMCKNFDRSGGQEADERYEKQGGVCS